MIFTRKASLYFFAALLGSSLHAASTTTPPSAQEPTPQLSTQSQATNSNLKLQDATKWRRFFASALNFVIGGIIGFGGHALVHHFFGDDQKYRALKHLCFLIGTVLILFVPMGKYLLSIQVVDRDGEPLGYGATFVRKFMGICTFYMSWTTLFRPKDPRMMYDLLLGTRVVYVPEPTPAQAESKPAA